jgi:hypothetical protein
MRAMRRPSESYSEVILKLVELKTGDPKKAVRVGWLRGFATSKGFRLGRQPRIGRLTADRAVIVSDLPTRTFKDGPLRGVFRQTYHA